MATRALVFALLALAVAAVVVVLVIVQSSGGGTQTVSVHSTPTTNAPSPQPAATKPTPIDRGTITVAVLNGTPTGGVAHAVSNRLTTAGFKAGRVANASDSTRTATVVAYLPGHRAEALAVASSLKLGSASVQPVDRPTQLITCGAGATCPSSVIVTVGTDLKTQ
jgi:hypothetical protein